MLGNITIPESDRRFCIYCGRLCQKGRTETWKEYLKRLFCSRKCKSKMQIKKGVNHGRVLHLS